MAVRPAGRARRRKSATVFVVVWDLVTPNFYRQVFFTTRAAAVSFVNHDHNGSWLRIVKLVEASR